MQKCKTQCLVSGKNNAKIQTKYEVNTRIPITWKIHEQYHAYLEFIWILTFERRSIYNEIWKANKGEIPKENYNGGIHKGKVQRGIFQRKSIKWNFSKGKLKGWIVDRVGFQIYFFSLIRRGGGVYCIQIAMSLQIGP